MDLREVSSGSCGRHPWEIARVAALQRILNRRGFNELLAGAGVLDIGCGDAFTIEKLCSQIIDASIDGVDVYLDQDRMDILRKERTGVNFYNSYDNLPDRRYDLLTMFDVIEHVESDKDFIVDLLGKYGSSGGFLFVTVPAFNSLFGRHDLFLNHYRRYNHTELLALLGQVGCKVLDSGYLFSALLPARFLSVLCEKIWGNKQEEKGVGGWQHGKILTSSVVAALKLDNMISLALSQAGVRMPGLTVWALCEIQ